MIWDNYEVYCNVCRFYVQIGIAGIFMAIIFI